MHVAVAVAVGIRTSEREMATPVLLHSSDKEDVIVLLVLFTPCLKYHFLMYSQSLGVFLHRFDKAKDSFNFQGYGIDLSAVLDWERMKQLASTYLSSFGPRGEVGVDAGSVLSWVYDPTKGKADQLDSRYPDVLSDEESSSRREEVKIILNSQTHSFFGGNFLAKNKLNLRVSYFDLSSSGKKKLEAGVFLRVKGSRNDTSTYLFGGALVLAPIQRKVAKLQYLVYNVTRGMLGKCCFSHMDLSDNVCDDPAVLSQCQQAVLDYAATVNQMKSFPDVEDFARRSVVPSAAVNTSPDIAPRERRPAAKRTTRAATLSSRAEPPKKIRGTTESEIELSDVTESLFDEESDGGSGGWSEPSSGRERDLDDRSEQQHTLRCCRTLLCCHTVLFCHTLLYCHIHSAGLPYSAVLPHSALLLCCRTLLLCYHSRLLYLCWCLIMCVM